MRARQLLKFFLPVVLPAVLAACGPKTPPPGTLSDSPTPQPSAAPKDAVAAKIPSRIAAVSAKAAKRKPSLQRPAGPAASDPAAWPVVVPLGPGHRAVPPAPTRTARRRERTVLAISNPPVSGNDGRPVGGIGGTVWKSIDSMPALPGPGGGSQHGVNQNGSRTEFDADDGTNTTFNKDGSIDTTYPNGDDVHAYGPGGGPDGMVGTDSHSDGTVTTYDRDGSSTTYNNDGSVDENNADGSDTHVYGPGGGPNGDVGYEKNPDGGSTTYHSDGSSTSTDPNGNTTDHPGPNGESYSQDPPGGPSGKDYQQDPAGGPNGKGWSNPPYGPAGDHPAKGTGEPHYYTRDGNEVTTQAAGEFVLVTGVPGRELQARHQPWNHSPSATAITALAMRVGDNKVEIRLDGTALINGEAAPSGGFVQGDLPGGGAVGVWRKDGRMTGAVVLWPDLSAVWVTVANKYLNLVAQWHALAPEHRGLLGSNDGNPDNDLTDRAGKVAARGDAAGLAAFVESWRVTDAESLFTYGPGESTATYTLRDFPKIPPDPTAHRAEAEAAAAGLPAGWERENCIYDIAVTGDKTFLQGYQEFTGLWSTVEATADIPPSKKAPASPVNATPTPPPEPGEGIGITPREMHDAAPMESGQQFKMSLKAGESRVYKFTPGATDNLTIYPADLSSFAAYQPGKDAGFAWFDDQGKMVGKPHQVHDDGPSPLEHPTGTFYLKIVGPGDVDIHHH